MIKIIFIVLLAVFLTFSSFAQSDDIPAEIQKYVTARGGQNPMEVNEIFKGDLNRDGKDDAVVYYTIQGSTPNQNSNYMAVFLNKRGKFVFASSMKLSADLEPVLIQSGKIGINRHAPNSRNVVEAVFYRLVGSRLVKTAMPIVEMRLDRITKLGSSDSDTGARVDVTRTGDGCKGMTFPKTVSGGVLNVKATSLPKPTYPAAARAVRAIGSVSVQVVIDEGGNVISANAVSGHPLLRSASESAARESRFSPTLLCGQPVMVIGVITYNFVP